MNDFPAFMKNIQNHIGTSQQNTKDINGYYCTGHNGAQMAFWTCDADRVSQKHKHKFDEYTVYMNDNEYVLHPGDELFIPAGTEQGGKCIAGTRTIHAFGGTRIKQ